jgi:tRNA pseudouridine55 synthase
MTHGWLNIYKPTGITSAKLVGTIKRILRGNITKVGHTGTLDPEAEGILPLALGEATKLSHYLVGSRKKYRFKVKFGIKTDTADRAGKIVETTDIIPTKEQCYNVVKHFIGDIIQTPPAFSAIKINGQRAYDLARNNQEVHLLPRTINIFNLKCTNYDAENNTATYDVECSKGTYIRTLAEDIAYYLQSLGFVLELARVKVGMFELENSINFADIALMQTENAIEYLLQKVLRVDAVLADIPVLDINDSVAYKIRSGQIVHLEELDTESVWIRYSGNLLAIGKLHQGRFDSKRVFNL